MNRKALLIGCPGKQGAENYLHGVAKDLTNYDRFLRSPLGGAWYAQEVVALNDPPADAVRGAIQLLKAAEYSFVLFSGHGYVASDGRSTIICLHDGEEMDSTELRVGAKRHTLLLDCCREVAKPKLAEDVLAKMDAMTAARKLSTSQCRRYYDEAISECPMSALIVAHSCALDEVSNENPARGGWYAYGLIEVAEDWAENNTTDLSKKYATFGLPRAHDEAIPVVRRLSGYRQNPIMEKPKSGPYFPFAIVA